MSLDSRIRDELRRTADAASTGVDPATLDAIVGRASRVRRERRLTVGVIVAVVLVGSFWAGVVRPGGGQGGHTVVPISPPRPSASASEWRPVGAVGDQSVLDGTWTVVAKAQDLRAGGVSTSEVSSNAGTWTFTVGNGRLHAVHGKADDCMATTTVDGGQWSVVWDPGGGCDGDFTVAFVRVGDNVRLSGATSRSVPTALLMNAFFTNGMALVAPG